MGATGNDKPTPGGPDRRTSETDHTDGDRRADSPANHSDDREPADNAVLLDEIETLLHELSSEHSPSTASASAHTERRPDPEQKPQMPQGPNLSVSTGYDLAKPVDYVSDPARYDYRRASENPQPDVAIQSMARKLAPGREAAAEEPYRQPAPRPAEPPQHLASEFRDPAGGIPGNDAHYVTSHDEQEAERLNLRRRRLRLRPARRVPGSRPEAQFSGYPQMDQIPDSEWDPRAARAGVASRSSHTGVIGAGVMLLLVAGVAGAFTFIDPLNRLLPGGGSEQEGPAAMSSEGIDGNLSFDLASGGNGAPEVQSGQLDRSANAMPEGNATGDDAAATAVADNSAAAPASMPETGLKPAIPVETPASSMQTAEVRPDPEPSSSGDKSAERLNQDSVVQAILSDPQKRALDPSGGSEVESEPATTGSIGGEASADAIRGANAVARQASASHAGRVSKRSLETEETVKVAGLAPSAPFGVIQGEANAPSESVQAEPVQVEPQQQQPAKQQVARTENTDLNSIDIRKSEPSVPNPAGNSVSRRGSNVDILLQRGHNLLKHGDIVSARMMFQRVVDLGDSRGAEGMGMTYDPDVFDGLPVAGMAADIEKAEYWYRKAREFSAAKRAPDVSGTERMPASGN